MYKLLIVDDEKIVIEGLKSAVNWQEHQIEIAGSATDGEEALKEIMNKKPDIVLVDIRMPKLNGLDLIQETKALHLDTVFIIISGYSKFDYAKRAIQLEAVDYLVKPIEVEEIVHSIKKAMLKLEKIKNEKQATERLNEYQTALEEKRVLNSNIYETIPDIKKANSEAKEALKNSTFSNQSITYYGELETFNHSFGNRIIEKIDTFFNEKGPNLLSCMNLFMDQIFHDCLKNSLPLEKSKYVCFKIVNHFLEYIESEYEVNRSGDERYLVYQELNQLQSFEEIRVWLEQFIEQSTAFLNENHVSYNEKLIIDLKSFIHANYKEPIVLDDLGKLFHKNPAYLCSLFSKAVGNTIFEYITKVRLNNAKKLLRTTNLKVSEICKQVGYENQKYFNQVFKKNIGTTPGLYRSQHILKLK